MERIASLLPSATEIACALGLREQLVGRSHECDFPSGVETLPVLSEPKLDPTAPSGAIDARVRELVREGLSGHHYMNRPGPRLVESLEILAEILHSDVFAPRHRGSGWEPWSAR